MDFWLPEKKTNEQIKASWKYAESTWVELGKGSGLAGLNGGHNRIAGKIAYVQNILYSCMDMSNENHYYI